MAPAKTVTAVSQVASPSIDPDQTLKASKALLAHIKKAATQKATESEKKNLLHDPEDEETLVTEMPIWLTLTTKRHIADSRKLKPSKITLPHPLNADETTICLISASPQRTYKNIIGSDEFPSELRERITRIIDVEKLKAKYRQYEAQRKLFSEHDIFLGDDRIINRLPKLLGNTFYKTTTKRPIPVNLQAKVTKVDNKRVKRQKGEDTVNAGTPAEMAAEIQKAIGAALVSLTPTTNTAVKVGYAAFTAKQLAANVQAVAKALVEKHVPQKWQNVRSIYIKGPETAALPIWLTDELWLEEKDVVANDSEVAKAIKEKPNVGKKRKSPEPPAEEVVPVSKKAKKAKKAALPEGNDDQLDKQIAEAKEKLKKQKAKAKAAMDD